MSDSRDASRADALIEPVARGYTRRPASRADVMTNIPFRPVAGWMMINVLSTASAQGNRT